MFFFSKRTLLFKYLTESYASHLIIEVTQMQGSKIIFNTYTSIVYT